MGAAHHRNFALAIQAASKGPYFVEVKSPSKLLFGHNGSARNEELDYQVFLLRSRKDPNKCLAEMRVQSLPGCCGVVVFYSFSGTPKYVKELIEIGFKGAQLAGYGMAHLTLRSDSEIIPLINHDFTRTFRNGKTDNMICMVSRILPQGPREVQPNHTQGE